MVAKGAKGNPALGLINFLPPKRSVSHKTEADLVYTKFIPVLALLATLTLFAVTSNSVIAQSEVLPAAVSLKFAELNEKFRNNQNLQMSDFAVFPEEMRRYLLAYEIGKNDRYHSAFSRKIGKRTFLIVFNREGIPGNLSKAVILQRHGKVVSPSDGVKWQPLNLPALRKKADGWTIYASDFHFNLEWVEGLEAVKTTYCGDVTPVSCIRHTTKVSIADQELLKVEVYTAQLGDWEPIYENGILLPNPQAKE